tara:strand:+ start:42994 stop:44466 length:1473 start_codon:yes stop_codon:yes gene_type:complete
MNAPIIFKLLSVILATIGGTFCICLGIEGLYHNELFHPALKGWVLTVIITFTLTVLFRYLGRNASHKIFRRESLCVIGVGWILVCVIGSLPYMLILPDFSFTDALFESTSGLTTTGATIFIDLSILPPSLMFWRCISQWLGGLGIVVFFVAILSYIGAGAKTLYSNEASAQAGDIDSGRIQEGVLKILALYLGLSFACLMAFHWCGLSWFNAICHMFTTVATGGFSTLNDSLGGFENPALEWTAMLFMILGGTSFLVMIQVLKGNFSYALKNSELFTYLFLIFAFGGCISILLTIEHVGYTDAHSLVRDSFFQTISILTTTGYTTTDYNLWPRVIHILIILMMVMGGCSGSTSGGVKIVRFVIAAKICLLNIEKSFRARLIRPITLNKENVDSNTLESVLTFMLTVGLLLFICVPLLGLFEHESSFKSIVSMAIATLFNIGPGFGSIGPSHTYTFLTPATKLVLSIFMIMGRLEFYAILVLFIPSFWRRH